MRALIVTTFRDVDDPELVPLVEILASQNVGVVISGMLGAGAYLAKGMPSDLGVAIAILPPGGNEASGWSALMVEAGICLGTDIPLLTIVPRGHELPPALSGQQYVRAGLSDIDTLRLHVGMFVRAAEYRQPRPRLAEHWFDLKRHARTAELETAPPPEQTGSRLEWQVADLLRGSASMLARGEPRRRLGIDDGVDLAFSIGDPAKAIVVVVEVKTVRPEQQLEHAVSQLSSHVVRTRADLGLLVTDRPVHDATTVTQRGIVLLTLTQLQEVVRAGRLESILRDARNRAVHGA
ncbi:hypothetical protein HDA40_001928 [Hamadaea flava]|uniref:Restriction endonuclease type IV Mrr domain-containing protein n=1 Tax=Hamadaea flava TaxID=1742688 RepID=A0ABV8LFN0_9ACTN|nr:hypothetical protein [Hamadaea flava]MCP2323421.1 hypothetical protein [Hamadaea flava]